MSEKTGQDAGREGVRAESTAALQEMDVRGSGERDEHQLVLGFQQLFHSSVDSK